MEGTKELITTDAIRSKVRNVLKFPFAVASDYRTDCR